MVEPESHVDPVVPSANPSVFQLSEEDRSAIAAEVAQLLQPALGSVAGGFRPAPGGAPIPSTSTSGKKVHNFIDQEISAVGTRDSRLGLLTP